MKYPFLEVPQTSVSTVEEFGGINKNIRIGEAEFHDMKNMTDEEYPLISTRRKRTALPITTEKAKGIISKDDSLFLVEESDGDTYKLTVKETVEAAEKPSPPEEISELAYDASIEVKCDIDLRELSNDERLELFFIPPNSASIREWAFEYELLENNSYRLDLVNSGNGQKTGTGIQELYKEKIRISGLGTMNLNDSFTLRSELSSESTVIGWQGKEFCIGAEVHTTNSQGKIIEEKIQLIVENLTKDTTLVGGGTIYEWTVRLSEESKDRLKEWTGTPRIIQMWFPCIEITKGIDKSYNDYLIEKSELKEAHKEALEQYEKDCKTEIFIAEPITADVAKALKQCASIDRKALSVESVTDSSITVQKPHGVIEKGSFIDTEKPYISFRQWTETTEETRVIGISEETGERQILSMGAYAVIFPDKVRVNTLQTDEKGNYTDVKSLEHVDVCRVREQPNLSVQVILCNSEYEEIPKPKVGQSTPTGGANGEYWIDTSGDEPVLKVYSIATSIWSRAEAYLKICSYDIVPHGIEAGDSVRIIDADEKDWSPDEVSFSSDSGGHIVYDSGVMTMPDSLKETYGKLERPYIVIKGCLKKGGVYAPEATDGEKVFITIKRTVPLMSYVVETGNRLWGCYYGINENGKNVNEIYASKLGDPANWNSFEGTAMDSYAASVGSDGEFTGATVFENNPIFFKENCMHRVFGNYPENYQIITQSFPGIEKGSEKSAATVNGILFYKAQDGIYGYDGASSVKVSDKLKERYKNAIGGSRDGVYFVSMEDEKGERWLFTYDVSRVIWHKQDNVPVEKLLNLGQELLIKTSDSRLLSVGGHFGEAEEDFDFLLQSGDIGYSISSKKYITKINLQMILTINTRVYVDIRYDKQGDFENILTTQGGGTRSVTVPIRPRRCERFELRIYGKGEFKLISVQKTIRKGSDIR